MTSPERCTATRLWAGAPYRPSPVLTCSLRAGHEGRHLDARHRLEWTDPPEAGA